MLRHEQYRSNADADQIHPAEITPEVQEQQQHYHNEMQPLGDPQRILQAEEARDGP
ncbi:hypothetical protein D3C81_2180030 [compost metagenome]